MYRCGYGHGHLLRFKFEVQVYSPERPATDELIKHVKLHRVVAAVARGMALRAMGYLLLGVSKVFLRHVAPTRYGDQTLSAGEHSAPGFSQWRLALAA
jgi:hypothetical protein